MSRQSTNSSFIQSIDQLTIRQFVSRLTLEQALWILIVLIALAMRLAKLDTALLSGYEAQEALFAWQAANGLGMPKTGYSPLLLTVNALLFTLCGTSDTLARLFPALCGTALVAAPVLLRRNLGQVGALCAGVYLALSPTFLFASRQLDATVVASLSGMALLAGILRFFETERRPWLTLSAGGLALGIVSSPSAYGLFLALGAAGVGVAWAWPGQGRRWLWGQVSPHLRYVLVVCLLTVLALATGMGWNLAGLGGVGDLLAAWLARFGSIEGFHTASPVTLLAVYEPLALLFGIGGLAWAIQHTHRLGTFLGMWTGIGTLLLLLMPGRMPLDVSCVVLPLALLFGLAVEQIVWDLGRRGEWLNEGLHIPVVVLLWIHLYLMLARYSVLANSTDLALALLTIALQGLLAAIFGLAMKFDAALRAVAVGTGIILLVVTLSTGWGIAYVRPSDPRELLTREPTAVEVRDLTQTLRDLSWRETGFPVTLPIIYTAAPDSALTWYVRDFSAARRVEQIQPEDLDALWEAGGAVLTTDLETLESLTVPSDTLKYAGQDFVLLRQWALSEVACVWEWPPRCRDAVAWLLSRKTASLPAINHQAVLWVRSDE